MDKINNPVKENTLNGGNDSILTERSNINISKTYLTPYNLMVCIAFVSVFVLNIVIASLLMNSLDTQNNKIRDIEKGFEDYKKEVNAKIDEQSGLITLFIKNNR